LVWARRFTGYKRSTLVLRDQALIERWLGEKKIQILIAGKFHPRDTSGREGFEEWLRFSEKHPNVAVLPNYELALSKELKLMSDVWLNTPRRPLEASGTSGMSANLNGSLHCTTHDGWSVEGTFHGINGFLINPGEKTYTSDEEQDEADYQSLRHVLETMVIPTYWDNQTQWQQWVWRAKETAESQFNTHRMVLEYYQRLYGVLTPQAFQQHPNAQLPATEPALVAV
jgi:glycogen phosphorylase